MKAVSHGGGRRSTTRGGSDFSLLGSVGLSSSMNPEELRDAGRGELEASQGVAAACRGGASRPATEERKTVVFYLSSDPFSLPRI